MASYTLYGIPNCNTVKKAMDWLKEHKIDYVFHNFKKEGITSELLNDWFKEFGWENVVNKKGLTFKKLDKKEQAAINNPEAAASYLMQQTSAIKRPILMNNAKALLIGFDEGKYIENFK